MFYFKKGLAILTLTFITFILIIWDKFIPILAAKINYETYNTFVKKPKHEKILEKYPHLRLIFSFL